jgi:hypothetical protein
MDLEIANDVFMDAEGATMEVSVLKQNVATI